MATPFLALNQRDGTPQIQRYVNSSPTGIGTTFGTADDNTGYNPSYFMNKCPVVQFEGDQTFYATVGSDIYRSTNGGSTWSSVHTLVNLTSTIQSGKSGLYTLYDNGVPNLVLIYLNYGTPALYAAVSADGTTWTEYGPFTDTSLVGGTQPVFCGETIFRGNLTFLLNMSGSYIVSGTYSPNTNNITFADSSASTAVSINVANMDLSVFNNNLYALVFAGAASEARLLQLTGGAWISVATLDTGLDSPGDYQGKWALFVEGSFMYAMFWKNSATNGWRCIQINSSLSLTDISATVLPVAMTATGVPPSTSRLGKLIDNEANPGTAPNIYLYFAQDGSSSSAWEMYQWNGSGAIMTSVDAGGAASDAMPFFPISQGSTYWTSGDNTVEIVNRNFLTNGIRFSFTLYSVTGTDVVNIRCWQGNANAEYPITAATLSNPSAGTLVGVTVTGLTADNTTIYQVTWNAITDGFGNGDYFKFIFEQYI